jgi:cobalt-zinc-cadmium efflux system protein
MSFGLLKKTSRILMEGTPPELSLDEIKESMEDLDGVEHVPHIHVWELDEHHRALEAHVVIGENRSMEEVESLKTTIKEHLDERFSITHSTLEFESAEKSCRRKANGAQCSD